MLRVAIVVVSSKIRSGAEPDGARIELEQAVDKLPGRVVHYEVVSDDRKAIREAVVRSCGEHDPNVVLTIGGTGVRPTDWAPEATRDVIDREIPGIGEAMRQESLKKVRTAMLSRGIAGIRGAVLVVNLPGSPRGARENLAVVAPILEHAVAKISKGHNNGKSVIG